MRVLILGCGAVGLRVGSLLAAAGHAVLGVRRRPDGSAAFPLVAGDLGDPGLPARLGGADAVLVAAAPGLRSGGDGAALAEGVARAAAAWPAARLVLTGSTAVYGEAGAEAVDEDGILAGTPRARALLAIESAALGHPRALVLRVAALVGPGRRHLADRLAAAAAAGQPLVLRGDPQRPFSYLHEEDLAELCLPALAGDLGTGTLNAAAPDQSLTWAGYCRLLACQAGLPCPVLRGEGQAPWRRIAAGRLHRQLPGRTWRGPTDA